MSTNPNLLRRSLEIEMPSAICYYTSGLMQLMSLSAWVLFLFGFMRHVSMSHKRFDLVWQGKVLLSMYLKLIIIIFTIFWRHILLSLFSCTVWDLSLAFLVIRRAGSEQICFSNGSETTAFKWPVLSLLYWLSFPYISGNVTCRLNSIFARWKRKQLFGLGPTFSSIP